ncbi:MAG TPA: DNA translocase FtsK 4TM domain-containing protein, partial [Candidatus Acidoferrum sp.]|nr:DNA translocase FtsK 4TM domain-containing protein [Candidatus Acidoferrum sp.]
MRFLTPTENKRLNELIGFLCLTLAILIGLSLLSYNPHDAAFNVSASPLDGQHPTRNWIGPAGSYTADLLFQIFGFAAFLLPAALLVVGWRWLRSRAIDSQVATLLGYGLLLLSLPALLSLMPFPGVRGAIPAGGFIGTLIAGSLRSGFNVTGAYVVAFAVFLTSVFMTTSFSFAGTHAWAKSPTGPLGAVERLGLLQKAQARWHAWQEEREQQRMRRRVEENRVAGRKPAAPQSVGKAEVLNEAPKSIRLADESDIFTDDEEKDSEEKGDKPTASKAPIFVLNRDNAEKPARKLSEAKVAKIPSNYRLPSPSLLREGEGSQKLDEEELKARARAIEEKCMEFDIAGRVTQINPGPVVTTFEFKPEAGIKYSRIIGLTEDLCLALQAESILIERIPGKSTIGIEVPNINRQTIALREIIEAPEFIGSPSKLTLAMGRDLHGRIRITDLAAMPH